MTGWNVHQKYIYIINNNEKSIINLNNGILPNGIVVQNWEYKGKYNGNNFTGKY